MLYFRNVEKTGLPDGFDRDRSLLVTLLAKSEIEFSAEEINTLKYIRQICRESDAENNAEIGAMYLWLLVNIRF